MMSHVVDPNQQFSDKRITPEKVNERVAALEMRLEEKFAKLEQQIIPSIETRLKRLDAAEDQRELVEQQKLDEQEKKKEAALYEIRT